MSLFGHHHGDPSLAARAGDFLHAVPVPIWAAVLGVLAAVAAPALQHAFARSRDRSLAAAEERRRAHDLTRTVARVRADLLVRVRAHLDTLSTSANLGEIDVERWHRAFESLATRVRDPDVIDALGESYEAFVRPIHAENVAIETERALVRSGRGGDPVAARVANVVAAYEPALVLLADVVAEPPPALGAGARRGR